MKERRMTRTETLHQPDSPYAMVRLGLTLLLMTIGICAMYVVAVAVIWRLLM